MDFSRVVRVNVFLTDTRHFAAMNQVYRSYFPDAPPTRATVATDLALPGALVEIEMVAARPGVERRIIEPEGVATPALPYSWGIQAGNTLFVAGATSRNPETYQPVAGDIATQTRQVLENIGAVLRAADMDYSDVTECSVFLGDARDFGGMNQVYRSVFSAAPPARATVRAQLMNPTFKVEIQCTAVRGGRQAVIPEGVRPSATLSPAIAAGDRLYLSGFTGRGPDGYAPGDVREQTRQALSRLESTLAADGLDFSHVVSARIYLTDIRSFAAVNEIYMATVPGPRPARSTVGTVLMSADALVEIQMTAVR
jgi:2-iminobutanoate/2-iminopropanoate deaminase